MLFCTFLKVAIYPNLKFRAPNIAKLAIVQLQDSSKQNWFHVNSVWKKYPEISTLCGWIYPQLGQIKIPNSWQHCKTYWPMPTRVEKLGINFSLGVIWNVNQCSVLQVWKTPTLLFRKFFVKWLWLSFTSAGRK